MSVQRVSVIRVNPNRSSTIRAHPYKPNQIEIQSAPPTSNGSNNNWNRQTFQVQESANRTSFPVWCNPIQVQHCLNQQVGVKTQRKTQPQSETINNQSVIFHDQNLIDILINSQLSSWFRRTKNSIIYPYPVINVIVSQNCFKGHPPKLLFPTLQ